MKSGDWRQIEGIFQEALQRAPAQRDAHVREACRGDSDLQREVSSLLANHHNATDSDLWAAQAAAQLIEAPVSLQPGQLLGPYRIECFLAAGGSRGRPRFGRDVDRRERRIPGTADNTNRVRRASRSVRTAGRRACRLGWRYYDILFQPRLSHALSPREPRRHPTEKG